MKKQPNTKPFVWVAPQLSFDIENRLSEAIGADNIHFFRPGASELAQLEKLSKATIIFGNIKPEWLEKAPNLKWIQLASKGINKYLAYASYFAEKEIQVSHVKDHFSIPVAETAIASIFALYRGIPQLLKAQETKEWIGRAIRKDLRLIYGSRAVIMGPGKIGKEIQQSMQHLGSTVKMFGRNPAHADITSLKGLHEVLPETDILILVLPETPETRHILNEERLKLLPKDAIVLNVGRGSAIDEEALLDALNADSLAAAALDVTQIEPLPADHPFWTHPKVLMTQHSAGGSVEEWNSMVEIFLANYDRYVRGGELEGKADFGRGY